ncbi:hypothetical protein HGI15_22200 [Modestobacter lapidis]|nr:hypothetical protein [Modestobacter lapidis]
MDDGTNQNGHIKLCTDSFSPKDISFLQGVLYNKYGIVTTIHNAGNKDKESHLIQEHFRIYIRAKSMPTLINLIDPFMIPSMKYKLGTRYYKKLNI